MTKREFYNIIVTANVSEEVTEFAKAEINKMDAYNAKRKSQPSKKAQENAPLVAKVKTLLEESENPMLASDIAQALEITVSKAGALAKMVEGVVITDVIIKGKGARKAFSL